MADDIEASWDTLLKQAPDTAEHYFHRARQVIQDTCGVEYLREHPELVIAFMQTAAADFMNASMVAGTQKIRDGLLAIAAAISDSSETHD
jgi:hypothetical protein